MKSLDTIGQLLRTGKEAPSRTLLELLGKQRLVVEYHRGIVCYDDSEIVIKASYGLVHILGNQLRLCRMSREQLCIRGEIQEIKLVGREGNGPVEQDRRNNSG